MPDLKTSEALVILLLAVVPGYIAIALWRRTKTFERAATDLRTILPALAVSLVIQIIASPLTMKLLLPVRNDWVNHPKEVAIWAAVVVILIPVVGGVGLGRLSDLLIQSGTGSPNTITKVLRRILPQVPPSPWDLFFLLGVADGDFLIIELNDGTKLAGLYSQPSFIATSPQVQGIYLASEWLLDSDGNIDELVPASKGFLIPRADNIKYVRVLKTGVPG